MKGIKVKQTYLTPSPTSTIPGFFFSDNFALHYPDLLDTVDFPVLVKLNKGFDIDMLLFRLVPRTFWIKAVTEMLDTLWDIKSPRDRYSRQEFDFFGHSREIAGVDQSSGEMEGVD